MIRRSVSLSRFSAATTPPRIASGTTMMKASAASLSELTSASPTRSLDRDAVGERLAQVALEEARDPVPVLREQGLVGAELRVEGVDRRLVGERAEDPAGDVAGQDLRADEDDHAQQEERDDREARAA